LAFFHFSDILSFFKGHPIFNFIISWKW